jgi:Icc-related predicted phosphoesterase
MRIVHISDTHMAHNFVQVPDGDVLVHTGDALNYGSEHELIRFASWMKDKPHRHKIYVPGNHDRIVEKDVGLAKALLDGVTVLIDESIEINGVYIWGSPYTPMFNNWAFMKHRGEDMAKVWEKIPQDTQILLTHGPPMGVLDVAFPVDNLGCEELAKRMGGLNVKLHLFGHIHESRGYAKKGNTEYYNSAIYGGYDELLRKPQVIDFT